MEFQLTAKLTKEQGGCQSLSVCSHPHSPERRYNHTDKVKTPVWVDCGCLLAQNMQIKDCLLAVTLHHWFDWSQGLLFPVCLLTVDCPIKVKKNKDCHFKICRLNLITLKPVQNSSLVAELQFNQRKNNFMPFKLRTWFLFVQGSLTELCYANPFPR